MFKKPAPTPTHAITAKLQRKRFSKTKLTPFVELCRGNALQGYHLLEIDFSATVSTTNQNNLHIAY
jgi:hypothetical protein